MIPWWLVLLWVVTGVVYLGIRWAERRWAKRMVEEWAQYFPGQCLICSFQRNGYYAGAFKELYPEPHPCPERER